jgi:flagellin-specific chaperone FliS
MYFDHRLQEGNVRKQKEPIEEVLLRVRVLRDSWAEMLGQDRGEPVSELGLQAA